MRVPENIESPIRAQLKETVRKPEPFNLVNVRPAQEGNLGQLPTQSDTPPQGETKPDEPEDRFGYTVGGVVIGSRPAAVFKDAAGNQRLVMQGGNVDGESTLKLVRMDHVVVIYRGKPLHLKVGGE